MIPQLNNLFGEHTFFLDSHGLNIVEPAEAAGSGAQSAKVVNVANWSDANPNRLEPHEPEPTDVVVTLGFQTLIHYRLSADCLRCDAATAMRASPSCRCDS